MPGRGGSGRPGAAFCVNGNGNGPGPDPRKLRGISPFAQFAWLKMPTKRKQMHQVKTKECESLGLAHIATRSYGVSEFVVNRCSITQIRPDEETSEPYHFGGTKRQKVEVHGRKSV